MSQEQITAQFESIVPYSGLYFLLLSLGLFCSLYAGNFCARKSANRLLKNVSMLCLIVVAIAFFTSMGGYTLIENLVGLILTIAAIFAGAWWEIRKRTIDDR